MNITRINLAGRLSKNNLPECFASIHRAGGSATITVTLLLPGSEREYHVEADCPEDVFAMAERLQAQLDGCKGTHSEIQDYYRLLQNFTD